MLNLYISHQHPGNILFAEVLPIERGLLFTWPFSSVFGIRILVTYVSMIKQVVSHINKG